MFSQPTTDAADGSPPSIGQLLLAQGAGQLWRDDDHIGGGDENEVPPYFEQQIVQSAESDVTVGCGSFLGVVPPGTAAAEGTEQNSAAALAADSALDLSSLSAVTSASVHFFTSPKVINDIPLYGTNGGASNEEKNKFTAAINAVRSQLDPIESQFLIAQIREVTCAIASGLSCPESALYTIIVNHRTVLFEQLVKLSRQLTLVLMDSMCEGVVNAAASASKKAGVAPPTALRTQQREGSSILSRGDSIFTGPPSSGGNVRPMSTEDVSSGAALDPTTRKVSATLQLFTSTCLQETFGLMLVMAKLIPTFFDASLPTVFTEMLLELLQLTAEFSGPSSVLSAAEGRRLGATAITLLLAEGRVIQRVPDEYLGGDNASFMSGARESTVIVGEAMADPAKDLFASGWIPCHPMFLDAAFVARNPMSGIVAFAAIEGFINQEGGWGASDELSGQVVFGLLQFLQQAFDARLETTAADILDETGVASSTMLNASSATPLDRSRGPHVDPSESFSFGGGGGGQRGGTSSCSTATTHIFSEWRLGVDCRNNLSSSSPTDIIINALLQHLLARLVFRVTRGVSTSFWKLWCPTLRADFCDLMSALAPHWTSVPEGWHSLSSVLIEDFGGVQTNVEDVVAMLYFLSALPMTSDAFSSLNYELGQQLRNKRSEFERSSSLNAGSSTFFASPLSHPNHHHQSQNNSFSLNGSTVEGTSGGFLLMLIAYTENYLRSRKEDILACLNLCRAHAILAQQLTQRRAAMAREVVLQAADEISFTMYATTLEQQTSGTDLHSSGREWDTMRTTLASVFHATAGILRGTSKSHLLATLTALDTLNTVSTAILTCCSSQFLYHCILKKFLINRGEDLSALCQAVSDALTCNSYHLLLPQTEQFFTLLSNAACYDINVQQMTGGALGNSTMMSATAASGVSPWTFRSPAMNQFHNPDPFAASAFHTSSASAGGGFIDQSGYHQNASFTSTSAGGQQQQQHQQQQLPRVTLPMLAPLFPTITRLPYAESALLIRSVLRTSQQKEVTASTASHVVSALEAELAVADDLSGKGAHSLATLLAEAFVTMSRIPAGDDNAYRSIVCLLECLATVQSVSPTVHSFGVSGGATATSTATGNAASFVSASAVPSGGGIGVAATATGSTTSSSSTTANVSCARRSAHLVITLIKFIFEEEGCDETLLSTSAGLLISILSANKNLVFPAVRDVLFAEKVVEGKRQALLLSLHMPLVDSTMAATRLAVLEAMISCDPKLVAFYTEKPVAEDLGVEIDDEKAAAKQKEEDKKKDSTKEGGEEDDKPNIKDLLLWCTLEEILVAPSGSVTLTNRTMALRCMRLIDEALHIKNLTAGMISDFLAEVADTLGPEADPTTPVTSTRLSASALERRSPVPGGASFGGGSFSSLAGGGGGGGGGSSTSSHQSRKIPLLDRCAALRAASEAFQYVAVAGCSLIVAMNAPEPDCKSNEAALVALLRLFFNEEHGVVPLLSRSVSVVSKRLHSYLKEAMAVDPTAMTAVIRQVVPLHPGPRYVFGSLLSRTAMGDTSGRQQSSTIFDDPMEAEKMDRTADPSAQCVFLWNWIMSLADILSSTFLSCAKGLTILEAVFRAATTSTGGGDAAYGLLQRHPNDFARLLQAHFTAAKQFKLAEGWPSPPGVRRAVFLAARSRLQNNILSSMVLASELNQALGSDAAGGLESASSSFDGVKELVAIAFDGHSHLAYSPTALRAVASCAHLIEGDLGRRIVQGIVDSVVALVQYQCEVAEQSVPVAAAAGVGVGGSSAAPPATATGTTQQRAGLGQPSFTSADNQEWWTAVMLVVIKTVDKGTPRHLSMLVASCMHYMNAVVLPQLFHEGRGCPWHRISKRAPVDQLFAIMRHCVHLNPQCIFDRERFVTRFPAVQIEASQKAVCSAEGTLTGIRVLVNAFAGYTADEPAFILDGHLLTRTAHHHIYGQILALLHSVSYGLLKYAAEDTPEQDGHGSTLAAAGVSTIAASSMLASSMSMSGTGGSFSGAAAGVDASLNGSVYAYHRPAIHSQRDHISWYEFMSSYFLFDSSRLRRAASNPVNQHPRGNIFFAELQETEMLLSIYRLLLMMKKSTNDHIGLPSLVKELKEGFQKMRLQRSDKVRRGLELEGCHPLDAVPSSAHPELVLVKICRNLTELILIRTPNPMARTASGSASGSRAKSYSTTFSPSLGGSSATAAPTADVGDEDFLLDVPMSTSATAAFNNGATMTFDSVREFLEQQMKAIERSRHESRRGNEPPTPLLRASASMLDGHDNKSASPLTTMMGETAAGGDGETVTAVHYSSEESTQQHVQIVQALVMLYVKQLRYYELRKASSHRTKATVADAREKFVNILNRVPRHGSNDQTIASLLRFLTDVHQLLLMPTVDVS